MTDKEEPVFSLRPGDRCPDFTVTLNDGSLFSSSDMEGKTTVICFFNTACQDCRRELPLLELEYEKISAVSDMQLICISREEGSASVESFWNDNGLTMPYSAQDSREVYSLFANRGIPRIYKIGPDRVIVSSRFDY